MKKQDGDNNEKQASAAAVDLIGPIMSHRDSTMTNQSRMEFLAS